MTTIAGMDLGYGSQVKVVRTNFLTVNCDAGGLGTAKQLATYLALYNQHVKEQAGGNTILECDYIIGMEDDGSGNPTLHAVPSGTDPTVVDASASTLVHLMGPSRNFIASASGLSAHQDDAAHIGTSANGKVIAVLSAAIMTHTGTNFTAGVALDLLGGTAGAAALLNAELLADATGTTASTSGSEVSAGMVPYVDIANLTADVITGAVGDPKLDFTNAGVAALVGDNFVAKGNAAGTGHTTIATLTALGSDVGTAIADTTSIISIVSLMRTAQ
jgi:hypothetical protein